MQLMNVCVCVCVCVWEVDSRQKSAMNAMQMPPINIALTALICI